MSCRGLQKALQGTADTPGPQAGVVQLPWGGLHRRAGRESAGLRVKPWN